MMIKRCDFSISILQLQDVTEMAICTLNNSFLLNVVLPLEIHCLSKTYILKSKPPIQYGNAMGSGSSDLPHFCYGFPEASMGLSPSLNLSHGQGRHLSCPTSSKILIWRKTFHQLRLLGAKYYEWDINCQLIF